MLVLTLLMQGCQDFRLFQNTQNLESTKDNSDGTPYKYLSDFKF